MKNLQSIRPVSVPVGLINVDHSYQRQLSATRVKKIAEALDSGAVKAISLSRRSDGTLWVYDGQHTLAAFKVAGIDHIPALIVDGCKEQEAMWFLLINGGASKRVTQREKLAPGVVSGDPAAVSVHGLLAKHGVTVISGGSAGVRQTNAVGLMQKLAARDSGLLGRVFDEITAAWCDQPLAWSGRIISGVSGVMARDDGAEVMRLLRKKRITPQRIEDAISAAQAVGGMAGSSGWGIAGDVMLKLAGVKK